MDKKCFADKDSQSLGNWGENLATKFLLNKKYQLLRKNFRKRGGQIDLIMKRGEELIFVEVKTRRYIYFGMEEDALSSRQLKTLIRCAFFYVQRKNIKYKKMRFDLITIDLSQYANNSKVKIRHYIDLLRYE